jgi:hypothetical protein
MEKLNSCGTYKNEESSLTRQKFVGAIAVLVVLIILMGILIHHYGFDLKLLLEPAWLSVIASLILAFLTAIYVVQTQGMLREMAEARKAEFLPHIKPGLKYPGGFIAWLLLKNVGKGAAINVDLTFGFQSSEESFKHWAYPLLTPEESHTFILRPSNFNELVNRYDFLVVSGSCQDVFGQKHVIDEKIDLKEAHKGWSESMMILEPSLESRLKEVSEELKRVGQEIRDTTRGKRTLPVFMRFGSLEIQQPPLEAVFLAGNTIHFFGKTLNGKIHTQLKKFKEGDIEEIYCNDHHGVIASGVYEIKKIELKKESVGRKVIYSFSVSLEYNR